MTAEEVLGAPRPRKTITAGGKIGQLSEEASKLPRSQQERQSWNPLLTPTLAFMSLRIERQLVSNDPRRLLWSIKIISTLRSFMDSSATATEFRSAFNNADWSLLRTLFNQGQDEKEWRAAMAYVRDLRNAGYKIESHSLSSYKQPNWPMFNECDFFPPPEEGVYFFLVERKGKSQQLFFGLNNSKLCYYVEKKATRQTKNLSAKVLKQDTQKISDFIRKTASDYAGSSSERISTLEIRYSVREGFVSVGFQHSSPYDPGQQAFSNYDSLLMPHWMAVTQRAEHIQILGNILVGIVSESKASKQFKALPKHDHAEIQIEESEGMFSWPEHKKHGSVNLI